MRQLDPKCGRTAFCGLDFGGKTSGTNPRVSKAYDFSTEHASEMSMRPFLAILDTPPSPELMRLFPRPILPHEKRAGIGGDLCSLKINLE